MVGFGKANLQQGKKGEAVLAFDQALDLDSLFDNIPQDVIAGYRDQALGKASGTKTTKQKATRPTSRVSK